MKLHGKDTQKHYSPTECQKKKQQKLQDRELQHYVLSEEYAVAKYINKIGCTDK